MILKIDDVIKPSQYETTASPLPKPQRLAWHPPHRHPPANGDCETSR
eukprot:COSAG02_NODE_75822_length_141_cov_54.238095_1_plen_46_part_11